MDLGFKNSGFNCINAFDSDKYAIDVHSINLTSQATLADLTNFDESILSQVRMADVLIAGPPCQGFSTAGKNNPNDERNSHLKNVALIAADAKPKIVVIENVKGLLSKKNEFHFQSTISTLQDAGYQVSWELHNTADHGVAQNRNRVLILATLSSQYFELSPMCKARRTLGDILDGVNSLDTPSSKMLAEGSDDQKIAKRINPGQKLSNVRGGHHSVHTWEIPEVFGKVTRMEVSFLETVLKLRRQKRRRPNGDADPIEKCQLAKIFESKTDSLIDSLLRKKYLRKIGPYIDITNTFNGKYRRLVWDEAAPTVDTRFGQARYFLHPVEHRGFSIREAARIQSFPDDFKFQGPDSVVYRMIGNAVPPKFAETIASCVKKIWSEI